MLNTSSALSDALLARRSAALASYNDAITSDGATAASWASIARELEAVAAELTGDAREYIRARAVDAAYRAVRAQRMTALAATHRTVEIRARRAVNRLYRLGWSVERIQRVLYDRVRVCKSERASSILVEMDEVTRS